MNTDITVSTNETENSNIAFPTEKTAKENTEAALSSKTNTKKQLRKEMLTRRNDMSLEARNQASETITYRLFTKEIYRKAKCILLYASYQSEVDTWEIFRQARCDGKKVYYPKCEGEEMSFYEVRTMGDLQEGYKGIMEPTPSFDSPYASDVTIQAEIEKFFEERLFSDLENEEVLMILPGAAFDLSLNRIGYGKGFYDRFLSHGFKGKKLALAYDCQVLKDQAIPVEETDYPLDYILTEKDLYIS